MVNKSYGIFFKRPNTFFPNLQVSIRHNENPLCAGVIVDERSVLTTAHCFNNLTETSTILVKFGSADKYSHDMKTLSVDKIFVHKEYKKKSKSQDNDNDIAKLEVNYKF